MDPASLALACAGIAGLTKAAKKMTRTMIKVYRDKDGIRSDIHASIKRLQTTTGIIGVAMVSLKKAIDEDPDSEVAIYLTDELVLEGIGDEAELLSTTMNDLTKKIKSTTTFRDFRWVLRMKKKVDALIPFSSNVHLLLQSAANSILLERSKALPPPSEARWKAMADTMLQHIEVEAQHIVANLRQIGEYELKPAAKILWRAHQTHEVTNTAVAVNKVLALSEELQSTGNVPQSTQSETSSQASTGWSTPSFVSDTKASVGSSAASVSDQDEIPIRPSQPEPSSPTVHKLYELPSDSSERTAENDVYSRHPLDHSRWELEEQAHGCLFYAAISKNTSFDRPKLVKCQAAADLRRNLVSPEEAKRLGLVIQSRRPMHARINDYGPFMIVGVIKDVYMRPSVNSEVVFSLDFMVCEGLDWLVIGQTLFKASP